MKSKIYQTVFVCLFIGMFSAYSQDKLYDVMPLKEGKIIYEGVVSVDSTKQSELQRAAKKWFIDTYKSSKDVIGLDEPDEIMGKGVIKTTHQAGFMTMYQIDVQHTVDLQFKDGKYRYSITDFRTKFVVPGIGNVPPRMVDITLEEWADGSHKNNERKYITKVDAEMKTLIQSLESALKSASKAKKDW